MPPDFTDDGLRAAREIRASQPEVGVVVLSQFLEDRFELTPRDREVLVLMAEGRSNLGIAEALTVTVAAVERHVTAIFDKLVLQPEPRDHRRVMAVLHYLRR